MLIGLLNRYHSMARIHFIYLDAGGGHRSAALALKRVIEQQSRPWEIILVNLQELLDPIDIVRKLSGVRSQDFYNFMLKRGWTYGSPYILRMMQRLIRRSHRQQVEILKSYWRVQDPDLVVSFIPNFNRAIHESLRNRYPITPLVTILTDIADYPPHFWIERQDQYLICGSQQALWQAQQCGHTQQQILQTSGMILNPDFYQPRDVDRKQELIKLGLNPDLPTGLVLFGGHGSSAMLKIVRRLESASRDVQLILLCGHNMKLAERLRQHKTGKLLLRVEGFTREVPYYMSLADFFIGKPGPGSISEALTMRLPVIVECNRKTMVQERYNIEWIRNNEMGIVIKSFNDIGKAVTTLLTPDTYTRLKTNTAQYNNNAVFEIPDFFSRIIKQSMNNTYLQVA